MPTTYGKVYPLSLPSGNKVKVRRPSLITRVRTGQLPSALLATVWQTFGRALATSAEELAKDPERIISMLDMMDAAVCAASVSPKITPDGPTAVEVDAEGFTTGTVNVADIPDGDKAVIFGFFQQVLEGDEDRAKEADLARFRDGAAGAAGGSGGEAVRPEAEQPAAAAP